MTVPASRPDAINKIITGINRYNPENIAALEDYVLVQSRDPQNSYDCNTNLALLKLYQFNPDTCKLETVANIMTMAMMRIPMPDFSLCLYLLEEEVVLLCKYLKHSFRWSQ